MRRLDWLISRKDVLTLLLAVILSSILLFSNDAKQISTLQSWALDAFGYLLKKTDTLTRLNDVYEENRWLRKENAELMLENSRLREARLENKRLREMLEFKSESQLNLIPAKVIGQHDDGIINGIVISAGQSQSVHKNMAVVTAQGLIGKVHSVSEHYSTVQLMLDRNFRVSAKIQRTRVNGIIHWNRGNEVELTQVLKRSDVRPRDVVVTSGLSTIFPGGLVIGTITDVSESKQSMFAKIHVRPAVDFSRLEEIFIVLSKNEFLSEL